MSLKEKIMESQEDMSGITKRLTLPPLATKLAQNMILPKIHLEVFRINPSLNFHEVYNGLLRQRLSHSRPEFSLVH
ncbi:hypothetical protein TNCV_2450441 [Trichonephila clavipes]|nr:hypothetical protein TNCV_2450441 [Trichonephila clavipes]